MYRFSSIENKEKLLEAVRYVAAETTKLALKTVGRTFPIRSLTIFSHGETEYSFLTGLLADMGDSDSFNNGPRIELSEPIEAGGHRITHLRIRRPDPERPQAGCSDFETDYGIFKREYLLRHPDNLILIKRPEYEMIEFRDKDFDVFAYVVSGGAPSVSSAKAPLVVE